MRKLLLIIILSIAVVVWMPVSSSAGDLPVPSVEFVRNMLLLPDNDFSIFEGSELCDAFLYIIDTDEDERVVRNAIAWLRVTEDKRSVPYLIEYIDEFPLDCLYNLGWFSTVESFKALLGHINDEDEFNRRYAAQSLGKLDYTVSEEMWEFRDKALAGLNERLALEKEEWIIPILNKAITAVKAQVFIQEEGNLGN